MITYNKAKELIMSSVLPLDEELIPVNEADGRILARDIISDINIPPLDNSAMDGFAVMASETIGASEESPLKMKILDEIQAGGDFFGKKIESAAVIRIMTGAPIPAGADAIIPVEDIVEDGQYIIIKKQINKYDNYRFSGEDIKKGDSVLRKGRKIISADVGLIASLNYTEVAVYRKAKVAIIPTGNEIIEIGEEIRPGQIRNSNAHTLIAEVKKYGGIPQYKGIARDSADEIEKKIREALDADIIITTGGVSMGKYDLVKDVLGKIGVDIIIEKVRIKPGKPFVFGTLGEKLFFGFPGNPVSTMLSFLQFAGPALLKMMGAEKVNKPIVNARLENPIKKKSNRKEFMRGIYTIRDGAMSVSTTGPQGSGILTSMSMANCLIILPEESEGAEAGDMVPVQLIQHEEI